MEGGELISNNQYWSLVRSILETIQDNKDATLDQIIQKLSSNKIVLKFRKTIGDKSTIDCIQIIVKDLVKYDFLEIKEYDKPKGELPLDEYSITFNGILLINYLSTPAKITRLIDKGVNTLSKFVNLNINL